MVVVALCAVTACSVAPAPSTLEVPSSSSSNALTTAAPADPAATPLLVVDASPTPEPPLAARANGQPIYLADYERQLGRYQASLSAQGIDPNSPEGQEQLAQQRDWILNVMIEQVLTEQAAAAAGVTITDEEVNAYIENLIAEHGGREAFDARLSEVGDTYDGAWQEVRAELIGSAMTKRITDDIAETAEHVHARHILVSTMEEAERILAQLQASADFAELARIYSQDTSTRENGGDLGFFPRGVLVAPEVEAAAFALQPGQFSGVVTSVLGYHIVQVVERDPARPINPESLDIIKGQALQRWIEGLWAQAQIERFVETAP
jgi:parvulin-like peptidyl-prolyl isomerase